MTTEHKVVAADTGGGEWTDAKLPAPYRPRATAQERRGRPADPLPATEMYER